MKIEKIDIVRQPHRWKTRTFVLIHDDQGQTGIGESSVGQASLAVTSLLLELKEQFVGTSPFDVSQHRLVVERDLYADGGQIARAALAGLEEACWDLIAKSSGQPMYNLFGGRSHDKLPMYINGWYAGPRTPEDIAARAAGIVADHGVNAFKIDPFGATWRTISRRETDFSIDIVRRMRKELGDQVKLIVEGHSRFDLATASYIARQLEPLDITWFEEPLHHSDFAGYRALCANSPVPVATGESYWRVDQFVDLLNCAQVPIIQFDPTHVGGLQASKAICEIALAKNAKVAPHSASGYVNEAVCAHLAMTSPHQVLFEKFFESLQKEQDPITQTVSSPLRIDGPDVHIEERPGLGCEFDLQKLLDTHSMEVYPDQNLFKKGWEQRKANAE